MRSNPAGHHGLPYTHHALRPMQQRARLPEYVEQAMVFGQEAHGADAVLHVVGRREVARWCAEGVRIDHLEGVHVLCSRAGGRDHSVSKQAARGLPSLPPCSLRHVVAQPPAKHPPGIHRRTIVSATHTAPATTLAVRWRPGLSEWHCGRCRHGARFGHEQDGSMTNEREGVSELMPEGCRAWRYSTCCSECSYLQTIVR
jgi:hypothetical protein